MTGVDKILIIIVLVFSVVFVIAALGAFSKSQESHKADEDRFNAANKGLMSTREELDKYKGDNEELKKQNDSLRRENKNQQKEISSLQQDVERFRGENEAKDEEITRNKNTIDGLRKDLNDLQADVAELAKDYRKTLDENANLRTDVEKLQGDLNYAKKVVIQKLEDKVEELEEEIEILRRSGGGEPPPDGYPPDKKSPKVSCTVLEVKRGEGGYAIVGLNMGSEEGLRNGVKLFVWNSTERLKGRITIIEIDKHTSIARIDWEKDGKEIKSGDTATVQDF